MPAEPQVKRTVAFIDGQNLFHSARSAFGYNYPNYDVTALAQALCQDLSEVLARGLQARVGLLSISFDPAHDRPASLRDYALRMRMHPEAWQIVSLDQTQDRRRLLDTFGIMVVPAPLGEFEHNAALHIIDREARLVRIVDTTEPGAALELALSR